MIKSTQFKHAREGFSLVELVLILFITSVLVAVVSINVVNMVVNQRYNSDADRLDQFLQKCVQYAVIKNKTIEVAFYINSGEYEAYEIYEDKSDIFGSSNSQSSIDLLENGSANFDADFLEESNGEGKELTLTGKPMQLFFFDNIILEDQETVTNGDIYLRADSGGWQESFIVSLNTEDEHKQFWLRCDRSTATVRTYKFPTELPQPRKTLQ